MTNVPLNTELYISHGVDIRIGEDPRAMKWLGHQITT